MEFITSPQNLLVKEIRSLAEKKHREAKKLFVVEGARFVEEALREGVPVSRLVLSESFSGGETAGALLGKAGGAAVSVLPDRLFKTLSDTETPQGIMAVVPMKPSGEFRPEKLQEGLILMLDSIRDPGNLGTIVRTADAAGIPAVLLSCGCVDLYNPKVLRSTMGSVFRVPLFRNCLLSRTLADLKKIGYRTYASCLQKGRSYFDVDFTGRTAVVIGNEANGVGEDLVTACDEPVTIPMPGGAESLNAAVAASLFMYEAVRQRYAP